MRSFFRAVRYILPYKGRLAAGVVCAILISVTFAGGIAAVLPGLKILISDEGLHGWAERSVVDSRLGVRTISHEVTQPVLGQRLPAVLQVVNIDGDEAAAAAGLQPEEWIVAVDGQVLAEEAMLIELARRPVSPGWTLQVYNPHDDAFREVSLQPKRAHVDSRTLYAVVSRLPRPQDRAGKFPLFLWLLALMLVLTLLRGAMRFLQEYFVASAIVEGMAVLRGETYARALQLPLGYFSSHGTTDTMSRFIQDSGEIVRGLTTLFGKTMVEPAKFVGFIGVALYFDWKLTLLACLGGPPAFYLIRRLGKLMKRASKRALLGWSRMLAVLEETLNGIRVVKAYTMEPAERKRFGEVNEQLVHQQKRQEAIDAGISPAVEALGLATALVAAGIAGYRVLVGLPTGSPTWDFFLTPQMDAERFIALMGALFAMFDPVRKLSQVSTRFHRADAAAARVFELKDRPAEPDLPNAPALPHHERTIEFRDVTFTYPNAARPALNGVSLSIRRGESVAVVGANGSGKTTLLSLVPRFFAPEAGQVLIDGQDVAEVNLRSLRRQIGVVTQETVLFHATIAENIAYGLDDARREDIVAAGRQAFVDEFVRELPEGYDTVVGEHGATLSGGQRQRIAIARAILRDPSILIFDEATSQIDSESEARIYQAMEGFMAGRTTLMIAHRFSTVVNADRVVVMADGRIVDVGKHHELLQRCATYRTLFETQLTAV